MEGRSWLRSCDVVDQLPPDFVDFRRRLHSHLRSAHSSSSNQQTMFAPSLRAATRSARSLRRLSPAPFSSLSSRVVLPALATPFASSPSAISARALHATAPARSLTNLFEAGDNPPLSVNRLDERGFLLSDGLLVPGGVIFADGRAFLWDVDPPGDGAKGVEKAWAGWSKERFEIFERVVPRPGEYSCDEARSAEEQRGR